jgi:pyruvate dehydrogenase E2 component (dihydrolipoamide acetyltransferase)
MAAEPVANPAVRPAAVAPKRHIVDVAPWPEADFAEFGEIETRPVPRIQQLVGGFLSRNWVMIPHVTHHDEADITALDAFRKGFAAANPDVKVTALILLIKAVVSALKAFPQFNASLDASGKNLVMKKYFHIGIAVDAPSGLLVPVIRDCDKKSVVELAREVAAISAKARSKGLSVAEMSGGCFSISALGSIGGTAFTPIINAPEVAILGVTRTQDKPVRGADDSIVWRAMLPLSLSYDHRVINGADAARFCRHVADALARPEELA